MLLEIHQYVTYSINKLKVLSANRLKYGIFEGIFQINCINRNAQRTVRLTSETSAGQEDQPDLNNSLPTPLAEEPSMQVNVLFISFFIYVFRLHYRKN